ncbi:uncharacterized protein BNAC02G17160D isoform X1 [Brassica napus]|uniref:uncharacterized protein BNAC02G17160D isoform X1 n=1 Tax=Brassica napus TaxID=3708 RepID=UPI002078C42D|nr:uncharacterized protein BNAC02G17160D isoform X1 [Brassica napus]
MINLNIHFGGFMEKVGEDYVYKGELGVTTVLWELYDISWNKVLQFSKEEAKIMAPIRFIWFKEAGKEMKTMNYVYDENPDDMFLVICLGKQASELEIFIEYDISEHSEPPVIIPPLQCDEYSDSDGEVERPRKEEEAEKSEDELQENVDEEAEEPVLNENEAAQADIGTDVVEEVGDGSKDDRFRSVFNEGLMAKPTKEAYQNFEEKETAEREAAESDEECLLEDEADYPDTPIGSEEEWEQWDNPKGSRNGKPKFHGDLEKPPYIWLFQKFNSGLEFKDQLLRYSLKTQYDVKMAKSESNRIAVVCCGEKCKFRVYCSFEPPINKWMVKVCQMRHNHGKSSRVSMLKQGVIAGLFREEIRRNISLQAAVIKDTIKERYNIVVPLSKCYRGRRIALDSILEAQITQFGKLWDYEAELRRTHSGINTDLCTIEKNDENMFDCFYICFEEFRNTWKKCCRPVIGLDGCFLKWELTGDLLAAVGRDADNRMYPIAWAVVRGENKDTWGWFVKKLKIDLEIGNGENLTIISDKQKGLVIAIAAELPHAEHRMCARHIYANWRKQGYSRSEYKNLFWGVAYSFTEGEYEERLELLKAFDQGAYDALLATEPPRWCRAFFSVESHCADVHNNLSESFNRTIKMARSKPVINLLEDIRRQAMRRVSRRFLKAEKCDTVVTPITMTVLEKARIAKQYCSTLRSSKSVYEVDEFECGYMVNLSTHQCACRKWDLTGIPCKHAVCVMDDNEDDPTRYVAEYYYTDVLKKTYEDNIKPVNGEKFWKKTNKPAIAIPEFRKPRGRPKTRDRRKEPFEDLQNQGKSTRHGRIQHCSRCKQAGHIKTGCKNEPVTEEGPKNRRGRPRKHPIQVR